MYDKKLVPFVKWAGGKRQLLPKIKERMPKAWKWYYEPFVGGGALLFDLQPEKAVINDCNRPLIHTYNQIREKPEDFLRTIHQLDTELQERGKEYYDFLRLQYNNKLRYGEYDTRLAALFVFLNKHCFNGLYRVNKRGLFNVPYNNSRSASVEDENIRAVSNYLQKVMITNGDFEAACEGAEPGDFIFFDSPYAPLNLTSFQSYTKEGFSEGDHRRLSKLYDRLTERGCYCMLTNHNTDLIKDLYGSKGYRMDVVGVKRSINSDASKRVGEEVIICNY